MKDELKNVKETLKQYGQEHLLLKYDEMDDNGKKELLDQINTIDFDLMKNLYEQAKKPIEYNNVTIEPIEHVDKAKLTVTEKEMYEKKGIEAIKYNKLALVNKSIFEALSDTIKEAWRKYDTVIPWYLMTSRENNDATIKFFEENNYFGYPKEAVKFFTQGELPMVGLDGKILLDKDGKVKKAANGHGGTLFSMEKSGVLDEMKSNGIEWVFINGVDNVLVKPVDPL